VELNRIGRVVLYEFFEFDGVARGGQFDRLVPFDVLVAKREFHRGTSRRMVGTEQRLADISGDASSRSA
jgi:hypothetical protein